MQNNITEIVEYIDDILSEFGLDFDMSEDQEGTYLYDIDNDFNVTATIEVVDGEGDNQEIVLYFSITFNGRYGKTFFESRTYVDDDFSKKEYEENIYYSIQEFTDEIARLTDVTDDITSKIDEIKNICNENDLDYNDFITVKI